jgi:hypothetical protein
VGCGQCPGGAAAAWSVPSPGVTNDACIDCTDYNQTRVLPFDFDDAGVCQWQNVFGDSSDCIGASSPGQVTIRIFDNGGTTTMWLVFGTVNTDEDAVYGIDNPDCNGPNELSLLGLGTTACTDWPSTITVTPA